MESPEDCATAAQPNSGVLNVCIDCTIDGFGGPVVIEYLIPAVPTEAAAPTELGNTPPGVSLGGIRIEFPADTDVILRDYQIAALDDCGGHVNNAVGYHYHESTGCLAEASLGENMFTGCFRGVLVEGVGGGGDPPGGGGGPPGGG